MLISRRSFHALLVAPVLTAGQQDKTVPPGDKDWVCPMDPDYRSSKAGICPRCGMKLVLGIPDRVEYPLQISQSPELLQPGKPATLILRALDPKTRANKRQFEVVHEKLMHLFVVSENLEFFAHIHPTFQPDGSFRQEISFPYGGMYRLLADFYPSGAVPQLGLGTVFVTGQTPPVHVTPSLDPCKASNLTATFHTDPDQPVAGLETKLIYQLVPAQGLQLYLGAWAHMLIASEDLIDLIHVHPFLADGGATMQFNVIFPRAGLYRIWTQFQRLGTVNTTVFTIPVKAL